MKDNLEVGDKVYYTDNGPDDTGTVVEVHSDDIDVVRIEWATGESDDWFLRRQITFVMEQ